jgi:competence protein ComEC
VTNVIVVPLTTVALVPVALAACAVGLAWPAAGAALLPLPEALADTVLALVRVGATAGGGAVVAPPGPAATVLLEAAVLGAGVAAGRGVGPRARRALLAGAAGLALAGGATAATEALVRAGAIGPPRLRVTFLDVGQGDAALVELPDGARLLVDTGPDPTARAVLGAIRARGGRLDRIVLTHGHPDHAGGLAAVRASPAGASVPVWRNGSEASDGFARDAPRGAPPPWRHGGALVEVLWPPGGADDEALSENDRSVVLRIRFGRHAVLLCGDVEAEAEGALVAAGGLRADVVKAGHHGSRTSSTAAFVAATGAAHVVLSLGWANRFGFPAPEVVAAWTAAGARVWRTGRDGAVVLETDGDTMTLGAARE